MKIIRQLTLILVAAFLWNTASFGQNQWTRQSPLPTARNLNGVAWATATHGFAAGESETLVETFDAGATWRTVNLGFAPSDPFYNVYCRDAGNCFVVGNGADHWRTTNGGATWQQINSIPSGSWRQIDFVTASVGFMGSNGAMVRTSDGGATWSLRSGFPDCPVIYGMDFRDVQVGLAGGEKVSGNDAGPGIFKTTDAGVTWVRKFPQAANDVLWLNATTAITTVGVSIYRSTNAGETWSEISRRISTGLAEMTLLPNGTVVGVSLAGDAWRSMDGGSNWTRTLVGLGALPAVWNISFFDNQLGAIVGQSGFIFKTTDGGLTWAMLNNGIGGVEFRDLEMFDDSAGLAVGDNGYFLRTTDGGHHCETGRLQVTGVVLFRNEHLRAVSVVDANFAVAAGFDGVVYKTFDRGNTWESIGYPNLPGEYFISDVKFVSRNVGYVTGNRPGIGQGLFRTSDGGATWTPIFPNGGYSIDFTDVNRGWTVFTGRLGYRTTNAGTTWEQMILPDQGFTPTILKTDFVNGNEGWAVGWDGYAAHTTDGGRNWQLQNIASIQHVIIGLHALSPTEAFAVGASSSGGAGSFYHTTNAGLTWNYSPLPSQYSLSSIFATLSRKVWTSGYDGTVLHNPNFGGPTPTPTPTPTATPTATPTPTPTINVTIQTTPSGRTFIVDGVTYTAAQIFSWVPGSSHTIATTSPQNGGAGVRYVWSSWTGGGAISHTVAPTTNKTYTATFRKQYYLTMSHGTGGTVRPTSGWRNSGAAISISAVPATGYRFTNWSGRGTGSYSGTNNPASITMGGPITEAATFTHN